MFTLELIQEIHKKLQLYGVKDTALPPLVETLTGDEILTIVKDGVNVKMTVAQFLSFDMFSPELIAILQGDNSFVVWQKDGNEGKTLQEYYDFLREPLRKTYIVNDVLSLSSDGVKTMYTLSALPLDVVSSSLYINGLYREGFYFAGQTVILPYAPSLGSKITIKYFTKVPLANENPISNAEIQKLSEFYDAYLLTFDILTEDGDIVTHLGKMIQVDL